MRVTHIAAYNILETSPMEVSFQLKERFQTLLLFIVSFVPFVLPLMLLSLAHHDVEMLMY